MVVKATSDRGVPRKTPDGVDPNNRRTRKTQRDGHNNGVKIWSLCSVSSTLSHANLEQPKRKPCNKLRGKMLLKKPSCVFLPASLSCVLHFRRNPSCVCLCHCVVIIVSLWYGTWLYNTTRSCSASGVDSSSSGVVCSWTGWFLFMFCTSGSLLIEHRPSNVDLDEVNSERVVIGRN